MITGTIILLSGILIGYSIPFWYTPNKKKFGRTLQHLINNKRAKIVEPDTFIDLGIENE